MEAANILDAALKTVGIPVSRAWRKETDKKPTAYIVYQLVYSAGELFADDEDNAEGSTWRIDLFSRENYTATIQKVIRALKNADFIGVSVEAEQYEHDTGYYHISFGAKLLIMEE